MILFFFLHKRVVLQPFLLTNFTKKEKLNKKKEKNGMIFETSIIIFIYMVIINRKN